MKKSSVPTREAAHQTVTSFIKLQTSDQSIQIGFTDQKVSGRAGLLSFAGFLHWHRLGDLLARVLPHQRVSKKAIPVADLALGFLAGILAGAQKLTQVAHLRRDVMLPELLAIQRVGSQSSFTRFFQGFTTAGKNLRAFRPLWRWAMERLPGRQEGYSLDLDSTRLLHEDGHQEGVKTGYTRLGNKPCLHPLLAVLAEAKLVAGFWLRAGNASCASNVIAFTLDLLANLPRHLRVRLVRADSGFCLPESVRPIDVWRDYNKRAGCEEVIKQLDADFALPKLCVKKFWGTEAALSLAVFSYNLCVLFQRHVGWMDRVTAATLRYRLFTTGGIISQTGGVRTVRLAVRDESERAWWRRRLEKIQSPVPNCNAVPAIPW